jgi:hypothetical protein
MITLAVITRRFLPYSFQLSCRFNSTNIFPGGDSDLRGDGAIRRTEPFIVVITHVIYIMLM